MIRNFLSNFWPKLKSMLLNLKERARPRRTLQWWITTVLWLAAIVYVIFGIYFSVQVYHNFSETKATKFAVKIYPFPAVFVNNTIIWSKDYYQQLNYIHQFSDKTKQSVPEATSLRNQIVEQLIENKLLQAQALKYHISVSSSDVNNAYQKIVDQSGGEQEVKKVLNDLYGMNEKDFKNLIRDQVLQQKIKDDVIVQVKVSHIFIKDSAKADEIYKRAKSGEDFAALAKQYSEDTKSAPNGGELGWLSKGQLVVNDTMIPEFDSAAFSGNKGDLVGPIKTSIGYEIIKIEDKKGKINQSFDDWLAGLKKDAKIWRLIK